MVLFVVSGFLSTAGLVDVNIVFEGSVSLRRVLDGCAGKDILYKVGIGGVDCVSINHHI